MLTTNAVAQNSIVQIWNQIKNWSREDHSSLARLIEKSLDDESSSDETTKSFINKLDDNALYAAADFCLSRKYGGAI